MKRFIWTLLIGITLSLGSFSYGAEEPRTLPGIPKRKELPKRSLQQTERRKLQTLPRGELGWADSYLPEYTKNVIDPLDGLRTGDGRVAVMQGWEATVIYEFAPGEEAINGPGADLTIYTSDNRRYAGPYDVYVANYGDPDWVLIGRGAVGTSNLDFPPSVRSAQLVLLINQQSGETEIDGVQALHPGDTGGGGGETFNYYPDELVGLRSDRIDASEVAAARTILRGTGGGYRMVPNGEVEVGWARPANNVWREDDLLINADGVYQVWITDTRGVETYLAQGSGTQQFAFPNNISGVTRVRIKSDSRRPVTIYSIAGRR